MDSRVADAARDTSVHRDGSVGEHAYYDFLVGQSTHHASVSLRTQAEIDDNVTFSDPADSTTAYDADVDGARFTIPAGVASIRIGDQVRPSFDPIPITERNALYYWEARAPSYWVNVGDDGVQTYKAFQLSAGGDLTLEARFRYSRKTMADAVALLDMRVYGGGAAYAVGDTGSDSLLRANDFDVAADTWTHFWAFLDFESNAVSYWAADEVRRPVRVSDQSMLDWSTQYGADLAFDQFWFEFNTSQSRDTGPEAHMYGRNLVVLRNLDGVAEAEALVDAF
jgi:hypothetical protein